MESPQPQTQEVQSLLRKFNRLLLSYDDFKHAKLAATYILSEGLHDKYPGESYVTLPALNASMIMAYCRPFSGNKGVPDLPMRFLRTLTDVERKMHETVLFDRHKLLAHSDAEALAVEPIRWRVSVDIEVLMPVMNWGMAPLTAEATAVFLSAATKLLEATLLERNKLEPRLKPYFRIATGPDELLDQMNHIKS
jgi:hypothetical protein